MQEENCTIAHRLHSNKCDEPEPTVLKYAATIIGGIVGMAEPVQCVGVDIATVELLPGECDQRVERSENILINDVSPRYE